MHLYNDSRFEYSVVAFEETLRASFIGSEKPSDDRYAPKIVMNDKENATDVLSIIKNELADCTSFDFSVAFVTAGGIQILVEALKLLEKRGATGRILTSTYLNFNDPEALSKLLEFPAIDVRIYQGDLHAKGYFFNRETLSTFIIGSSNLTQTALTCNKEWNVLFRSFDGGEMLASARAEFERLWEDEKSVALNKEWILEYKHYLEENLSGSSDRTKRREAFGIKTGKSGDVSLNSYVIVPNAMQKRALEALRVQHELGVPRALLVSATGTGKTYLSALDVRQTKPKKVLFVAHRKRILKASEKSYRRVLGDGFTYGIYGEDPAFRSKTCGFAMVGALSKHKHEFDPYEYDYIVIDEAHRTGAHSYREILDYFQPKFVLGMTATPTRTDGYDVYRLFNHVIAYRITLQDALKEEMLVPFHYFGIADLAIDNEEVDDLALFGQLTSEERARHIIGKIEEYTVNKDDRKGLIFCSRNDEARTLSRLFNEQGYRTVAISGETSDQERDEAIERLENGELQYIFSVDILNEGIDIPSLNQIIMLRRTESTVVFMQQLGRGLRKCDSKEFTLVLDFIGNYQQNFLIPMALSGDRTYNKDNLRRVVKEGSAAIPGCSTISFDSISEKRIFRALEEGRFAEAKLIRGEFEHLKQVLGRIPKLVDFDKNESIDPLLIIRKYGSYPAFLQKYDKDYQVHFDEQKLAILKAISIKLGSGKRLVDLEILRRLIEGVPAINKEDLLNKGVAKETLESVSRVLTGKYSKEGPNVAFDEGGRLVISPVFAEMLKDACFREAVLDLVEFALGRNARDYADVYKDTDFVLNRKYTREEVCRLLRWEKQPNFQNVGGYFHDKSTNTFPVFINYEKDPGISITTQYEDRFVSDNRIIAISKSKRTLTSPEIQMLRNAHLNGVRCYLFVRKNLKDKDDGTEFYFLGEIHPTGEFQEITMADGITSAVEIAYELENPVKGDIYDFLTSRFDG